MKGIKLKAVLGGRKFALLGAAIAVGGLSLIGGGGIAHAALGNQPGTLIITPGNDTTAHVGQLFPLSTVPSWSTTVACPSTANGSAKLVEVEADGSTEIAWSAFVNGASTPISAHGTVANTSVGGLEGLAGYGPGQTAELVVNCFIGASGGGGTTVPSMDAFISYSADGNSYSISNTPPAGPASTTTTLSVQPSTVQVNGSVTLTATWDPLESTCRHASLSIL